MRDRMLGRPRGDDQSRGDNRDTRLDVAEIGAKVRDQLRSLKSQGKTDMVRVWLAQLEQDPQSIKEMYRQVFLHLRSLGHDEDMERKLAAWEERLTEVNS